MCICYYFDEIKSLLTEKIFNEELQKDIPFRDYIVVVKTEDLFNYTHKQNSPTILNTNLIKIFKITNFTTGDITEIDETRSNDFICRRSFFSIIMRQFIDEYIINKKQLL